MQSWYPKWGSVKISAIDDDGYLFYITFCKSIPFYETLPYILYKYKKLSLYKDILHINNFFKYIFEKNNIKNSRNQLENYAKSRFERDKIPVKNPGIFLEIQLIHLKNDKYIVRIKTHI